MQCAKLNQEVLSLNHRSLSTIRRPIFIKKVGSVVTLNGSYRSSDCEVHVKRIRTRPNSSVVCSLSTERSTGRLHHRGLFIYLWNHSRPNDRGQPIRLMPSVRARSNNMTKDRTSSPEAPFMQFTFVAFLEFSVKTFHLVHRLAGVIEVIELFSMFELLSKFIFSS